MLGRTSYHEGMLFLGLGMKQPRMNIVDATIIPTQGEGEGGGRRYWKYKRKIRSSFLPTMEWLGPCRTPKSLVGRGTIPLHENRFLG
jgi:hypothetical protein